MKKLLSILLLLLFVSGLSFAEELTFEPLEKAPNNALYTALALEGIEYPVYAYEHYEGKTAFRVYGQIGRKRGYYEANVYYENNMFTVDVVGEKPLKETYKSAANAKLAGKEERINPDGWYFNYEKGYYSFTDVFGKEYRFFMASYRPGETGYVPVAKNGRVISGALPLVPESVKNALKVKPYNFKLSKELKNGYAMQFTILTSNDKKVNVSNTLPELQVDALEIDTKIKDLSRVRVGAESAELAGIQTMLSELGYYAGDIDGIYGEGMDQGLRLFQKQNGITETGKPDAKTLNMLYFGEPEKNPEPLKAEDFVGNGVAGEQFTEGYLDLLGN